MRIILGMALLALLCGCGPKMRGDAARVAWDTGHAEDCKVYLYDDYVEIY